MKIGFHTDAFNTAFVSFRHAVDWASRNNVHNIECGLLGGVSWIHGLGYQPHVGLHEDPRELLEYMAERNVSFSQIDAAYPLSGFDGLTHGVAYIEKAIPWASHAGCPFIDTTDGLHKPAGVKEEDSMQWMALAYRRIVSVAGRYGIGINIEPHGYFTTKSHFLERMLDFVDSPLLGLNMDTGNTFIAGEDPVAYLGKFITRGRHVHVKDVSPSLAAAARGEQTGIALSHCALGEGANANNIRECLRLLHAHGYQGTLSIECEGQSGPMLAASLAWLRKTLAELGIPDETA
jgi:sugar phosphate isomerase/epimerase